MVDCDAVVIGAGHNGLTLAAYLQRAGLSTVLVDRAPVVGGQCRTDEPLLPGFTFHPHANFLNYTAIMPMLADRDLGAPQITVNVPEVQHGIAFEDGRPGIVLHRIDHLDRTYAAIARYSIADADTFVQLRRRAQGLTPSLARVIYQPPTQAAIDQHLAAVEAAFGDLGVTAGLGRRSALTLIDELFATAEMRTLMYLLATEFGVRLQEAGGDAAFLGIVLWLICGRGLPVGGMQTVTNALAEAATALGARLVLRADVATITVESGRATGVRLTDGRVIAARRLVASSTGLEETLLRLVEPAALDARTTAEVAAYHRQSGTTITSQHFCLGAPPTYRSARLEPDLDRAAHTFIGFDTPDAVLDNLRAVDSGLLPRPGGSVHVNSLHDPTQAPTGRASVGVNTLFPSTTQLSADHKERIRAGYNEALLHRWLRYAPNMTGANVLGDYFGPFHESDRRVLLKSGHDQYRSSIPGLYLCGTSTYPGGGVHGACGYNAFFTITRDLGLAQRAGQ